LEFRELIRRIAIANGVPVSEMAVPTPFWADQLESIKLEDFGAAIITSRFRPDYTILIN
jgi:hypothetical protein